MRTLIIAILLIVASAVTIASAEPTTRISDTREREVSVKSIMAKGKIIRIGYSSDQVLKILPQSAFMEQTVEGSPATDSMVVTKSYYHGGKYFNLVFMRISDSGYTVIKILEKRFD
jgi:hypothetical protein